MRCVSVGDEFRQRLTDDAGEFESVAGKTGSDQHVREFRMPIDDEVMVGCQSIHAEGMPSRSRVELRQNRADKVANGIDVEFVDIAIHVQWICNRLSTRMFGDLHRFSVD